MPTAGRPWAMSSTWLVIITYFLAGPHPRSLMPLSANAGIFQYVGDPPSTLLLRAFALRNGSGLFCRPAWPRAPSRFSRGPLRRKIRDDWPQDVSSLSIRNFVIFRCSSAAIRSSVAGSLVNRFSNVANISPALFPVAQTMKM